MTFLRAILLGTVAVVAVVLLAWFAFRSVLGNAPAGPDCATVQLPAPGRWAALADDDRLRLAGDLELCSRFDGRPRAAIEASLGAAQQGLNGDGTTLLTYVLPNGTSVSGSPNPPNRLLLTLGADGRVASTRIDRYIAGNP